MTQLFSLDGTAPPLPLLPEMLLLTDLRSLVSRPLTFVQVHGTNLNWSVWALATDGVSVPVAVTPGHPRAGVA